MVRRIKYSDNDKNALLEKMGKRLGPIFVALEEEFQWLCTKWDQYVELFGAQPKRVQISRIGLLYKAAPLIYEIVEEAWWNDILLHIARLTDPSQIRGNDNLTIRCLYDLIAEELRATDIAVDALSHVGESTNAMTATIDENSCSELAVTLANAVYALAQHPDALSFDAVVERMMADIEGVDRKMIIKAVWMLERYQRTRRAQQAQDEEQLDSNLELVRRDALIEAGARVAAQDLSALVTDPLEKMKERAITLRRLKDEVERRITIALDKVKSCRGWRNKSGAHLDRHSAMDKGDKPIEGLSRANVREAIDSIGDVLNTVRNYYMDSTMLFGMRGLSDELHALFSVLEDGLQAARERQKRVETGEIRAEDDRTERDWWGGISEGDY